MAQISRPFQIALLGVVLLAGVWLFAFNGHSQTPTASTPAATPAPAASSSTSAAAEEKAAAAPSAVYHGAAPGVAGLTRAIAKAHGAVAISQQNAKQLEANSARASSASTPAAPASSAPVATPSAPTTPAATATAPSTAAAGTVKPTTTRVTVKHTPAHTTTTVVVKTPAASAHKTASQTATPERQTKIEAQLKAGDVVVVLFWNQSGADDIAVQRSVSSLFRGHQRIAVYQSRANEVASYGSITRGVQIYGTPTVLVIGKSGQAAVLTGLTDVFAIQQAIDEARGS